MSTDQEVDTAPLLEHAKQKGAAFVPQYAGGHMKMLRVETGDEAAMDVTKHGIAQHAKDAARDDALESGIIHISRSACELFLGFIYRIEWEMRKEDYRHSQAN